MANLKCSIKNIKIAYNIFDLMRKITGIPHPLMAIKKSEALFFLMVWLRRAAGWHGCQPVQGLCAGAAVYQVCQR